jgi:hypothetical protein
MAIQQETKTNANKKKDENDNTLRIKKKPN